MGNRALLDWAGHQTVTDAAFNPVQRWFTAALTDSGHKKTHQTGYINKYQLDVGKKKRKKKPFFPIQYRFRQAAAPDHPLSFLDASRSPPPAAGSGLTATSLKGRRDTRCGNTVGAAEAGSRCLTHRSFGHCKLPMQPVSPWPLHCGALFALFWLHYFISKHSMCLCLHFSSN